MCPVWRRAVTAYDVAIVGSGFGGSLLARVLNRQGLRVVLIERGSHPRFALGESSTPLAALSLERLAATYDLPDLRQLASYGRWQRHLAHLGCGLKRGFTFYDHRREPAISSARRALWVAASPEDSLADCHWLRADVDQHLVARAQAEGVHYRERTEVLDLAFHKHGVDLSLASPAGADKGAARSSLRAGFLLDATGSAGLVRNFVELPPGPPTATTSSLVYGHFAEVAPATADPAAPYPADRAAVHHLIDDGWIYELRFDDGRVSAGALLRQAPRGAPGEAWASLIARYPRLAAAYAGAQPLFPVAARQALQHRMARASGARWAVLPHTFGFIDPLFSTGIAWTLRGVERLAQALSETSEGARAHALARYESLLQSELTQIDQLVAGAYRSMAHFELFAAYCLTYFAAVSWAEVRQRLLQPAHPMWEGFLGTDDAQLATLFAEAQASLPADPGGATPGAVEDYRRTILERIAARDIAGLDHYGPRLAVPVDLDLLVRRAGKLGLSEAQLAARLPRLRGAD